MWTKNNSPMKTCRKTSSKKNSPKKKSPKPYEKEENYYDRVVNFVKNHPEFQMLLPIAKLTDKIGYINSISDAIVYGIANAGVRADYGISQYFKVRTYLVETNFRILLKEDQKIQPKKVEYYNNFIKFLIKNNLKASDLNMSHIDQLAELKGIGVTNIALVKELFGSKHDDVCPYSHMFFITGMQKFYNLPSKPSLKDMKNITKNWTDTKIGSMFIIQYYNYYCRN